MGWDLGRYFCTCMSHKPTTAHTQQGSIRRVTCGVALNILGPDGAAQTEGDLVCTRVRRVGSFWNTMISL